jgi:uncharacterized protein (TIGR02453 family)
VARQPTKGVAFRGFDRDAMQFWHELASEMSREWFAANKQRYQSVWVEPMLALLREVARGLARTYGPRALAEPGVLRIYRDLRFARDRAPYKTHIAGIIRLAGAALARRASRCCTCTWAPTRNTSAWLLPVRRAPDRPLAARGGRRAGA